MLDSRLSHATLTFMTGFICAMFLFVTLGVKGKSPAHLNPGYFQTGTIQGATLTIGDSGVIIPGTGVVVANALADETVGEAHVRFSNVPTSNGQVLLYDSVTTNFKWAAMDMDTDGNLTLTTAGSALDITPDADAGGYLKIKEGSNDGSNSFTLKVPDGGLSSTVTCTLTAAGLIPASCLE